MGSVHVRPYEDRDFEAFARIRSVTYNNNVPIEAEQIAKSLKLARGFVAEVDGNVEGEYVVLDMTCCRSGAVLSCAGVAAVAVPPERRHLGVGMEMMKQSIQLMHREGTQMASLYPFRDAFYRKAGYETCGIRYALTVPNGRYPKVRADLEVRRIPVSERAPILACHEAFCRARSGMSLRTDTLWRRAADEEGHKAIYAAGDPVEAYAIVEHKVEFWVPQTVHEFVWTTERGYRAVLATLCAIGINKTELTWFEPSDSPFIARYLDQGMKLAVEQRVMYRVVDVPGTLRALKPTASGEFCVQVLDEVVPDNVGPWTVRYSPNGVEVQKGGDPDLVADIRPWTQAFLGEPSLQNLIRNGLVEVRQPEGAAAAMALLLPSPTTNLDFF